MMNDYTSIKRRWGVLSWLRRNRDTIIAAGWRLTLYEAFNFVFDFPLYGWVMHSMGLVQGWLIMTTASFILCAAIYWYYDHAGIDWMFAKAAREWEAETSKKSSWLRRVAARISKSRDSIFTGATIFTIASLHLDPVIVAVHFRKSHFKGISLRDWMLLIMSVTIGNIWWGIQIGLLVKVLEWLFKLF